MAHYSLHQRFVNKFFLDDDDAEGCSHEVYSDKEDHVSEQSESDEDWKIHSFELT